MKKIETLTKEQAARLPHYADKWLRIGLSTEPLDKEAAIAAIDLVYVSAGLTPPAKKLFVSSPLEGARAAAKAAGGNTTIKDQVNTACYGSQDANWLAYYDFFESEGLVDLGDKLKGLFAAAKTVGWFWAFENLAIISPRPNLLKRDEATRLHNETGPALSYPDGWNLYYWHGVSVPENWILDKKSITPDVALQWPNAEQRRCACEILGWHNVLPKLNAELLDKDANPSYGELYKVNHPALGGRDELFLKVICGTGRVFCIPVTNFKPKTAREANAATYGWKKGLDINQFLPQVRT